MTEKLVLVRFSKDFGRQGSLDGLFVCTEEEFNNVIGKYVYFGEVLGKHSEVVEIMEIGDFTFLSDDQQMIMQLLHCNESDNTLCGYNPIQICKDRNL